MSRYEKKDSILGIVLADIKMVNSMDKKKRRKKRWLIVAVVVLVVLIIAAFIYTPALPEVAKIADQM